MFPELAYLPGLTCSGRSLETLVDHIRNWKRYSIGNMNYIANT